MVPFSVNIGIAGRMIRNINHYPNQSVVIYKGMHNLCVLLY